DNHGAGSPPGPAAGPGYRTVSPPRDRWARRVPPAPASCVPAATDSVTYRPVKDSYLAHEPRALYEVDACLLSRGANGCCQPSCCWSALPPWWEQSSAYVAWLSRVWRPWRP